MEWLLQDVQDPQSAVLQKAAVGESFVTEKLLVNEHGRGSKLYSQPVDAGSGYPFYRLKIVQKNGQQLGCPYCLPLCHREHTTCRERPLPVLGNLFASGLLSMKSPSSD